MPESRFYLELDANTLLRYYRGHAKEVVVRDNRGATIRFPVEWLRPFMSHDGISGWFCLQYDQNGKRIGELVRVI